MAHPIDEVSDARRLGGLLAVFAIVIVFWMAFHQNGSTWTYWAAATGIGNYLVGTIGVKWTVWPHSQFFLVVALLAGCVSALLFALLKPLRSAMPGV